VLVCTAQKRYTQPESAYLQQLQQSLPRIIKKKVSLEDILAELDSPTERGVFPPNQGDTKRASGDAAASIGDRVGCCLREPGRSSR
jgi:hypothetical protein